MKIRDTLVDDHNFRLGDPMDRQSLARTANNDVFLIGGSPPVVAPYTPAGQLVHAVEADALEYFPVLHVVQVVEPAAE